MEPKDVILIGAGGHAKVVIATLQSAGYIVSALFDDDPKKWNQKVLGIEVKGNLNSLPNAPKQAAFLAVGNNEVRKAFVKRFNFKWINAIHRTAFLHESVKLGEGILIAAGVVIQPDTEIGSFAIINTASSIDHDCRIEAYSHIAPGSHLGGEVEIGEGTLIGLGTSVRPQIKIGKWVTVGVGSAVVKDLEDGQTFAGIPAKKLC